MNTHARKKLNTGDMHTCVYNIYIYKWICMGLHAKMCIYDIIHVCIMLSYVYMYLLMPQTVFK